MARRRLVDPLWAKAPLVLLRYPRLLISLAFGALLFCLVVAAEPLFLSAEAGRLVTREIAQPNVTPYGAGLIYQVQVEPAPFTPPGPPGADAAQQLNNIGQQFAARTHDLLGPVLKAELGTPVSASLPGSSESLQVAPFAGADDLAQVQIVQRGSGPGVWLADSTARVLGVSAGDTIDLSNGPTHSLRMPVAGIYHALVNSPRSGYWQPWDRNIDPACIDCSAPPPFALVDPARASQLFDHLGIYTVTYVWQAPVQVDVPLALDQAQSIGRFVTGFQQEASSVGSVFACCVPHSYGDSLFIPRVASAMPSVVLTVRREMVSLQSSAQVLLTAGLLIALIVLASAAMFGMRTRKVETRLLFSHGAHPVSVAARSGLESGVPVIAGGAAGMGLSFLLVRLILSDGRLSHEVIGQAMTRAGLAALAGLALIALVSGSAFVLDPGRSPTRLRSLARIPWELALVALAAYALHRLQTGGAFVRVGPADVPRPTLYVLLFPVLAIAGIGTLAARLLQIATSRLRARSDGYRPWAYLAIRRLAAGGALTLVLAAASVLCLGVFVQAEATVRSLQTTVDAKAHLFVGSDARAQVTYSTPLPTQFPLPLTKVTFVPEAGTFSPDGARFDLLAIDTTTFARAAFWDGALSDVPLADILTRLSSGTGSNIPIVVAGSPASHIAGINIEGRTFGADVVATPSGFPGMVGGVPLVVADAATLVSSTRVVANPLIEIAGATTEFWVKGPTDQASSSLAGIGLSKDSIGTAAQVEDIPQISAVIQSLEVLRVLALASALLLIIGLLGYLAARQRSQAVSYGLSLRMGMSHRDHRRSIAAELVSMLTSAWLIGVLLGIAAAALLVPKLDPLSTIPPGPIFVQPRLLSGVAFASLIGVSWLGAWLTNRRARDLDLGEVMRVAG